MGELEPDNSQRVDAALNEARALMAAGDISAGYERLNAALAAAGEPAIGGGRVAGIIQALGFLRGPLALAKDRRVAKGQSEANTPASRDGQAEGHDDKSGDDSGGESTRREVPPAGDYELLRIRAANDVRLGELIGYFDPISGIRFLRRAQRSFHRTGDLESVAWIDYLFAYFAIFGNPRRGPVPLSQRYLDAGHARLRGKAIENPEIRACPAWWSG